MTDKSISETMRNRGEGWALNSEPEFQDAREWIDALNVVKAERDGLKAQFAEIASIEGLTESEDGLPGSVRDLLALLPRPSEDAEALAQEMEGNCPEVLANDTPVSALIRSFAARVRQLTRPYGLSREEIEGITLAALALERHGVVQTPVYLRAIVAKLK